MHLNITIHLLHTVLHHLNPPYSTVPRFTRNLQCSKSLNQCGPTMQGRSRALNTITRKLCHQVTLPAKWRHATKQGTRNLPLIEELRQNSRRQLDDMKQFSGETLPLCSTNSNTGLFISPSGISELDCATTKTDTAERSISVGRESLQVFFLYYGPWRTSRFHRYGVVVKKNGVRSE